MADTRARVPDFKAPECRLAYAFGLFKARAKEGDKPKFSCTLIFEKKHKAALADIVIKLITDEWGAGAVELAKKGLIKLPILAGDGKEARDKTQEQDAIIVAHGPIGGTRVVVAIFNFDF